MSEQQIISREAPRTNPRKILYLTPVFRPQVEIDVIQPYGEIQAQLFDDPIAQLFQKYGYTIQRGSFDEANKLAIGYYMGRHTDDAAKDLEIANALPIAMPLKFSSKEMMGE